MPIQNRDHVNSLHDKVMVYLRLNRFQAAEELLRSALQEQGPLANLLNLMGICCHRQSKFSEAIEYFEKAKAVNPKYLEANLNLAVTLSDLGFYEASQKVYLEIQSSQDTEQPLPDLILGRLANLHCKTASAYEQTGLHDQAAQEYLRALQLYPNMQDIRLRLAKLYLKMDSYPLCREQLTQLLIGNPNHPECLNLLGIIAFRMGEFNEAKQYWQKTQSINPSDRISRTYLRSRDNSPAPI